MAEKLTPKQEAFVRIYIETSNASEAYRQAYDVGEDTKPSSVWDMASKALANPLVTHRVMKLQEAAQNRTLVTLESLTLEMEENRRRADELDQTSVMQSATMGKAKIHGYDVTKVKGEIGISDGLSELLARARSKKS